MIKVKAFGQQAEKYYKIIETGSFYSLQYARVSKVQNPNRIYPMKNEIVLTDKSEVKNLLN